MPKMPPKRPDTRSTILQKAVALFAKTGYSGTSMRDIAQEVGISAAALYHHFPDKDTLFRDAIQYAFADITSQLQSALETDGTPERRLALFVRALVSVIGEDPDLRMLQQRVLLERVLLDGNDERLKMLASDIFGDQFAAMSALVKEINPGCDAHVMAISIAGMVVHYFDMSPLRRFLSGNRPEHDDPDYVAEQITRLALHGIRSPLQELP